MIKKIVCYSLLLFGILNLGWTYQAVAQSAPKPTFSTPASGQVVYFNTNSHKFHNPHCEWAIKCTRNCIRIPYTEAIRRGGIPCKVCGGR